MNRCEELGRLVFRDQWIAYQTRCPLDYQCPICDALPRQSCTEWCSHLNRRLYRFAVCYEAAGRHLAYIETMSELFERSIRGASWLFSRLVLDLVTQGGNNEH